MKLPNSLPDAFLAACSVTPDKTLVHFEGRAISYRDIYEHVSQIAGNLNTLGLRRGDRVALYLDNSPSFITIYLGVLWFGGVVVPVNTRYRETELRHMLNDSGARLVVTDAAGRAGVQKVLADTPAVEHLLEAGAGLERDLEVWRALAESNPLHEPAQLGPDDLAVIGYTSGTTGRSKGAMLSHGNFCANSAAVTSAWGWTAADHLLLVLPLFHMHGLGVGLHGTLVCGSTITLKRRFDAAETLDDLHSGRISMFFGVPTMYLRLLDEVRTRPGRPKGLRLLVSGSAPLSPQTHAEVEREFGLRILERYGMTETVMNLGNPLHGERKAGSVGIPFEGVVLRIADAANTPLMDDQTGEIQLRGSNITKGYWRNPEATEEVWTSDGWFRTGDLGYRDSDGYVFLIGRAKELIISGGFNVYPREVEEVLEMHPAISEVAVFGLPDTDLGEKVMAAVVPRGDVSAESVQQFCRDRLASFKKPREIYLVQSLPRNALGKVQKHLLRKELEGTSAVIMRNEEASDVRP